MSMRANTATGAQAYKAPRRARRLLAAAAALCGDIDYARGRQQRRHVQRILLHHALYGEYARVGGARREPKSRQPLSTFFIDAGPPIYFSPRYLVDKPTSGRF